MNHGWLGSAFAIVGLGAAVAACGGASVKIARAPEVPLAPAGVYVDDDVARGYDAYALMLERWGRWSPDATYGVHWCPDPQQVAGYGLPFRPFSSRGHWGASEDAKYGAPPGAPFWVSDDGDTWGEITTHHGWWIQREVSPTGGARAEDWCWVPGAAETPARVVWRDGGGFVGWAPEPPAWVDDGGDGDDGTFAALAWTYEALGSVLEMALADQILTGDACSAAATATAPSRAVRASASASRFSHVGPGRSVVASAKRELLAQIHANGGAINAAAVASTITAPHKGPSGSSGDGSSSSSSSTKEAKSHDADDVAMPRAMIFMPVLLREGPHPTSFSSAAIEAFAHPVSGESGGTGSSHASLPWGSSHGASSSSSGSSWSGGSSSHASTSHSSSSSSSSHSGGSVSHHSGHR